MSILQIYRNVRGLYRDIQRSTRTRTIDDEVNTLSRIRTAEYVYLNLNECQSFNNTFEVHDYSAKRCLTTGEVLEFGVYTGTTIRYLCKLFPDSTVYGFDSFEGLPETWRTGFGAGAFSLETIPIVPDNCKLIVGWFDATLDGFIEENLIGKHIRYLHVDCDLYSSTRTVLEKLGPFIRSGTVIAFDEYFNYPGWENGEFKAFKEWCSESRRTYEYLAYNRSHEQVSIIITN